LQDSRAAPQRGQTSEELCRESNGRIHLRERRAESDHQSDLLRRNFHPLLATAKIPKNSFHGLRRHRNTYLRNETECPAGLLKYWLGHSASRDMSDRYDMVRDDAEFRRKQAEALGLGFKAPRQLKPEVTKPRKIVVRRVVRDFELVLQK
jgi:integrase